MQEIKHTFTCTSLAVKVGEGIVYLIYVTWIIHNSEIMTNYTKIEYLNFHSVKIVLLFLIFIISCKFFNA